VTLYRHLYIKYIGITYNITHKGSLYFGIPGVTPRKLCKPKKEIGQIVAEKVAN
jgi:hypothetical protein